MSGFYLTEAEREIHARALDAALDKIESASDLDIIIARAIHEAAEAAQNQTVVELNKRITALQMKLERVRDLVQNEYPHARAALLRILQGDE